MNSASPAGLWEARVATRPSDEAALAALLEEALGAPAVSATNLLTGRSRVSVYLEDRALPSAAVWRELRAQLRDLREAGLSVGAPRMLRVRREDWAESWKRHFPPLEIGRALLVRPSWSQRRGRRGQAVVTLDPGLSFGTGQHATTRFCLEQLVAARPEHAAPSCLDVGTGSGILAIAAAKLGYAPVTAFDFDAEAVRLARANAAANAVADRVRPRRADVRELPARGARFSLVCANLLADLLLETRDRLIARVAPQGRLVLAGILRGEFEEVRGAYEAAGLRLLTSRARNEWRSGAFVWRG